MKELLFKQLYEKAEKQTGNSTKHGMSSHLEKVFTDTLKFPVNKITFVRYYEKYLEKNADISNNPNTDLLNKISEYIGYKNYEDYITKNSFESGEFTKEKLSSHHNNSIRKSNRNNHFVSILKDNRVAIIIFGLIIIAFISFYSINKQRWMIWEKNNYIEVDFDDDSYNVGKLKLYSEERVTNFKQIQVDCNTVFFTDDGHAKIWYGKNSKKEIECFTSYGLHPETGKALNPITLYMIKKYICEDY